MDEDIDRRDGDVPDKARMGRRSASGGVGFVAVLYVSLLATFTVVGTFVSLFKTNGRER